MDIIGRVAFGHDFQSGQSTEAKEIAAVWKNHVNTGLTFNGFIAMLVIRAFPSITSIPLPAIKAGGRIKEIVIKLAKRIYESEVGDKKGRDILSILMRADKAREVKEDGLAPYQILENVSTQSLMLITTHRFLCADQHLPHGGTRDHGGIAQFHIVGAC